jgi:hypothetical protein
MKLEGAVDEIRQDQISSEDVGYSPMIIYAVVDEKDSLSDEFPAFGVWGAHGEIFPFEFFNDCIDFGSGCEGERYHDFNLSNFPVKEGRLLNYAHRGGTDATTYKIERITQILPKSEKLSS